MTKNELKQLIKEVINEVIKEANTNENWKDNLKVGTAVGLMAAAGPIASKLAPDVTVDGKVYRMTGYVPDNVKAQKVKTDDGKEVYIWQEPATGRHSHGQTNNLYVPVKPTNENYEDGIKDVKDRMAYLALRKQEKDYISKSKQSSSPIKKQHYMDMSKQVLDKALAILKKHKVID